MTRINAFIPPAELSDKHLLAEHREIKRIPNMVKSGKAKIENIPEQFTLGKGHVKFFYNKLYYLEKRYLKIWEECRKRGFRPTNYIEAWTMGYEDEFEHLQNDWNPPEKEKQRIRNLIKERIKENNIKSQKKKNEHKKT